VPILSRLPPAILLLINFQGRIQGEHYLTSPIIHFYDILSENTTKCDIRILEMQPEPLCMYIINNA
jgi:hypothetical protein